MGLKGLVTGAGMVAITISMFAQTPPGPKPSFEVASVKANTTGDNRMMIMPPAPTRFVATNVFLRNMITFAYNVRDAQLIGAPAWLTTDRWDIEAKAEEGSIPPPTGPPDPSRFAAGVHERSS